MRTVNDTLSLSKQLGIPLNASTEQTFGANIQLESGKTINLAGTIDLLWALEGITHLADLKTSGGISPQYGLQLSLYRLLLRAHGYDVDKDLNIIHTPQKGGPSSSVGVKALPDDILDIVLNNFLEIQELERQKKQILKDPSGGHKEKIKKIQNKIEELQLKTVHQIGFGGLSLPMRSVNKK